MLAYADRNAVIHIVEYATRQEVDVIQATGKIYALAWSPDGTSLASSSDNGAIQIWNIGQERLPQVIETTQTEKNLVATLQITWTPQGVLLYPVGGLSIDGLTSEAGISVPIPDLEASSPSS